MGIIKGLFKFGISRLVFNLILIFSIILYINFPEIVSYFWLHILISIISLLSTILRFKNLGRSGWYTLALGIPVYSWYLLFLLIFIKKSEKIGINTFLYFLIIICGLTIFAILGTIAFLQFTGI